MNRAIKYRIYPNSEQEVFFAKTFGCCRKVWNLMLAAREEAVQSDSKQAIPTPASFKADYPYLKEVDSLALANVQLNLNKAYSACRTIKGRHKPRFKSKRRSRASYTTNNQNGTVAVDAKAGTIRLPKAGFVKAELHRMPEDDWTLKSATVSKDPDGRYYCSVLYEYDREMPVVNAPQNNAIGLDYKSDGLYVDSNGATGGSPKHYRKAAAKLAKAQQALSRKQGAHKGEAQSKNYTKQRRKLARIHKHIANQRKDFLHKKSAEIANQYDMVCVEDLNMTDVAHAHSYRNYRKATYDNGYGMFLSMLEYKLVDRGKVFIKLDEHYPSTQTCSCCGSVSGPVGDAVRRWICPDCGAKHNRDLNAAINIKKEGIRLYMANNPLTYGRAGTA